MRAESVAELARIAGVSIEWLASGKGSPDAAPSAVRGDDPYPQRRIAVAKARSEDLTSERAIATAQAFEGEEFRFWSAPQWGELIAKLTLAEARKDPALFHKLVEAYRAAAKAEAEADDGPAPPKAIAR